MQRDGSYCISDFELLTAALSAASWRALGGSIRLITDSVAYAFLEQNGLIPLWDGGVTTELDDMPEEIRPDTFWAGGKLFALSKVPAPCFMIDTDFIPWHLPEISGIDLAVIHREDIQPDIYPPKEFFVFDTPFPKHWNWEALPCNTAFCYFGTEHFKRLYTDTALRLMRCARGHDELCYMVFVEQRLLSMCAESAGVTIHSFSDLDELFSFEQRSYTHLWGYKQVLHENPAERERFCRSCARRLMRQFPDTGEICKTSPILKQYFA